MQDSRSKRLPGYLEAGLSGNRIETPTEGCSEAEHRLLRKGGASFPEGSTCLTYAMETFVRSAIPGGFIPVATAQEEGNARGGSQLQFE